MNDITKNIQLDIVSLNNRFCLLERNINEINESIKKLKEIIDVNVDKERLVSLKECKVCKGEGHIINEDHCSCCDQHYGCHCSNCDGFGKLWS